MPEPEVHQSEDDVRSPEFHEVENQMEFMDLSVCGGSVKATSVAVKMTKILTRRSFGVHPVPKSPKDRRNAHAIDLRTRIAVPFQLPKLSDSFVGLTHNDTNG